MTQPPINKESQMKYQLLHNLGTDDANYCNKHLGTSLSIKAADLAAGSTVSLTEQAAVYLTERKGYTSLLEPEKVRGESKRPELTAPAK